MLAIDSKKLKPPYLIHSDVFKAAGFVKERLRKQGDATRDINRLHFEVLTAALGEENLTFPSFNYDFPKTKMFDVMNTPSQVGSLTNYVLNRGDFRRTITPVFSFLTKGGDVPLDNLTPFSTGSVFDYLYKSDGSIIFYGTDITSCTYLHFVESQFGPPVYRYEKVFRGTLIQQGVSSAISVNFHVRPLDFNLGYDWGYLHRLLQNQSAVADLSNRSFGVKARDLSNIWGPTFKADPLSFLDIGCRDPVRAKLERFGRPFTLEDFEGRDGWK